MAQFDVYALDGALVVDLQSDYADLAPTRVVAPLVRLEDAPMPVKRLNPIIEINGEFRVLMPQYPGSVSVADLGTPIANIVAYRDEVTAALDMLFHGF